MLVVNFYDVELDGVGDFVDILDFVDIVSFLDVEEVKCVEVLCDVNLCLVSIIYDFIIECEVVCV